LWKKDDLAVCVSREDCVDVGSVVCDAISVDGKARNGFDVYELIECVLLIGRRGYGEIFAILKQI
jgi:hypothetical protein